MLPARPRAVLAAEQEDDIPVTVLRASCDLEIVIPARNEARRLPDTLMRTVRYLERQPYSSSVVVIDNGSVDQTSDLVARKWSDLVPVRLTGCDQPGKGAAVRRGFLTSRARFVGYMDADLATPIETLDCVERCMECHAATSSGSSSFGRATEICTIFAFRLRFSCQLYRDLRWQRPCHACCYYGQVGVRDWTEIDGRPSHLPARATHRKSE